MVESVQVVAWQLANSRPLRRSAACNIRYGATLTMCGVAAYCSLFREL